MKKYRRLEARKRVDELQTQSHTLEIEKVQLALQQHLVGLEKEFSSYLPVRSINKKARKVAVS
jgi:hypothetical protein